MRRCSVVIIAIAACALAGPTHADVRAVQNPNTAFDIDWTVGGRHLVPTQPTRDKTGYDSIADWFQVAANASAVAMRYRVTGVAVYTAAGHAVLSRSANVRSFRLSSDGAQVAIATATALEIIAIAAPDAPRRVELASISWLGFAGPEVIARVGDRLAAIGADGAVRTLVTAAGIRAIVTSGDRIAYVTDSEIVAFDRAKPEAAKRVALPSHHSIVGAELSPDGALVLCSSIDQIFAWDGTAPPHMVVNEKPITTVAFLADGRWLWSAPHTGAVVSATGSQPLPADYGAAQLQAGGTGIVAVSHEHIVVWEPATNAMTIVGKPDPIGTGVVTAATVGSGLVTFTWLGGLCFDDPGKC
jgi:hypothetical protein